MAEIVDTTEMYIKVIYELLEDGIAPMRARIVERLNHSGPTVSQTVSRLERDGLLYIDVDRRLHLTNEGIILAIKVMKKHRLAERLLVDKLCFPWEKAHEEACKWEHVIGDEVLEYLKKFLGDVKTDPYGNPIPNLKKNLVSKISLLEALKGDCLKAKLVRIGEPVQVESKVLFNFKKYGVLPDKVIDFYLKNGEYFIKGEDFDEYLKINKTIARHLFVG